MRNVKATAVADKGILQQPMTLATADFKIAGTITGTGPVLIVDHTTDNTLVTFRFQHAGVKMSAAEQAFEAGGHKFAPGAFVIANADRAALEPSIKALGLSAWAVAARAVGADARSRRAARSATSTPGPARRTKAGSGWRSTSSRCPYTYFADNLVRQGNLKQKYDVIIFPHAGGTGAGLVYGGVQGSEPRPYKKTDETPHLGIQDSTDDMRGGLGLRRAAGADEVRAAGGRAASPRAAPRRSSRSST